MAINLPIVSRFDNKGIKDAESSLDKFGAAAGVAAGVAVAAVTGIAVASVKAFSEFESALNQSLAIMGDVSDTMKGEMSDAAREVAKNTTFSATEAAEAYYFLASAGLDAEQSIDALPQVAAFAQAGMFDMAKTTDLATDAQSALGLASSDAEENLENLTRVTDVFVASATLANTSVEQIATAMTSGAGVALKTFGIDIEEGSAALAVFADQGIKGEAAGTLLSNTLFGLSDRARNSAQDFERLGIEVFAADGSMNNLADIAGDLTNALGHLDTEQKLAELSALGFSKQARAGVLALIDNQDALAGYEEALRNAGGTVAEVAEKQMQTLANQFSLVKSNIDDTAIEIGSILVPILTELVTALVPIIDYAAPLLISFFEKLAPHLQAAADGFSNFSATLSAGGFEQAFASFSEFRQDIIMGIIDALPGILEAFVELLPKLVTFITDTMIPQMLENFTEIFTSLLYVVFQSVPLIVEAFAEVLPGVIESLAGLLPLVIETLLDMIPDILETAVAVFTSLIQAIGDILPDLIQTITDLLPEILDTLLEMLPYILETAIDLWMELVLGFVEVLPEIITALVDALPVILTTLANMAPQLLDMGFKIFFKLVDAVFKVAPKLIAAVIGLIPKVIVAGLKMIPKLIKLGADLIGGIVKGIMQAIPKLIGGALNFLFDSVVGGVKSLFGIASPSKVFAEFGGDMVDGLADGLKSGTREIQDAVSDIGEATDAAFNDYSGKLTAESKISGALTDGMIRANISAGAITPVMAASPSSVGGAAPVFQITVNAGMGTDGTRVGELIVNEILRFERSSGKVFARA
jgi:TP901 family phage tail tape measure protein